MKFRSVFPRFAAVACIALLGSSAFAKAKWTLMFYWAADNDLEEAMLDDVDEMLKVGSSDEVELIVLLDRSEEYTKRSIGGIKNWTTCKWLRVEKGKLEELEDWGEVDTGDPAVFEKFMVETAKRFPAENYHVLMNDHGGAWQPAFFDESKDATTLDVEEIQQGLAGFKKQHGVVDLLTMDACLMGCVEASYTFNGLAKYMVASSELVPLYGFEYTNTLGRLAKEPNVAPIDFAKYFVDNTHRFYTENDDEDAVSEGQNVTISLIDLDASKALREGVEELAEYWLEHGFTTDGLKNLKRIRARSFRYGEDSGEDEWAQMDVGSMLLAMKKYPIGPDNDAIVEKLEGQLKQVVVASMNGPKQDEATGISLFWPRYTYYVTRADLKYSESFSNRDMKKWAEFCAKYVRAVRRSST